MPTVGNTEGQYPNKCLILVLLATHKFTRPSAKIRQAHLDKDEIVFRGTKFIYLRHIH